MSSRLLLNNQKLTTMMLKALLLFGLIAISNAGPIENTGSRIVNGENAALGEIPYQVSLQNKGSSFHFCGGSILSRNFVITAAHCVSGKSPNAIKVVAGMINLDTPYSTHTVVKIEIHESYNVHDSWRHDIALLKVEEPFVPSKLISFVTLPSRNDVVNANDIAVVSGWGRLWKGGATTKQLQRVNLYIADQSYCRSVYNGMGYNVYDTQICAHDPSYPKGSCNGDSGGPLTINGKLIGLVSWANGCGLTDYPTVYTRVTEYIDWVYSKAV